MFKAHALQGFIDYRASNRITKRQYNTVSGFKWGTSEEAF